MKLLPIPIRLQNRAVPKLLEVLDAIWKNISEAVGVVLVYWGRILFLGGTFDGPVCNAGITVVLACIAYVLSKEGRQRVCQGLRPEKGAGTVLEGMDSPRPSFSLGTRSNFVCCGKAAQPVLRALMSNRRSLPESRILGSKAFPCVPSSEPLR